MSSVFAVSAAILIAAIDLFGENASIQFRSLSSRQSIGGIVTLGGCVDVRFSGSVRSGEKVEFWVGGMVGKVDFRIGGVVTLGGDVNVRLSGSVTLGANVDFGHSCGARM